MEKWKVKHNSIELHPSWIAANPIEGCNKNCEYCFLQLDNLTLKKPNVLRSPEEVIQELSSSDLTKLKSPIALGTRTDMFSTKKLEDYLMVLIEALVQFDSTRPIVLITKHHISDEFIRFAKNLTSSRNAEILFFISMSGLPKHIEPGIDGFKLLSNFKRLHRHKLKAIHYWRPITNLNNSNTNIRHMLDDVSPYATSSVVLGLRLTKEQTKHIESWPELSLLSQEDIENSESIWPADFLERLLGIARTEYKGYPIFTATSCAVAHALEQEDYNGIYGTTQCNESLCPDNQSSLCVRIQNINLDTEKIEKIMSLLNICDYRLDKKSRTLNIYESVSHSSLLFLRQFFNIEVRNFSTDEMDDSEYGWGSTVNRITRLEIHPEHNILMEEIKNLEKLRTESAVLKRAFSSTEKIKWSATTVASELMLQISHLTYTLMSPKIKRRLYPQEGTSNGLEDELADVIFNVLNLLTFLRLTMYDLVESLTQIRKEEGTGTLPADSVLPNLHIQSSNIWDMVARYEGYKHLTKTKKETLDELKYSLASIINDIISLARNNNINIYSATLKMLDDADIFLKSNKQIPSE